MELSIQHQVTNEAIKRAEDHANAVHPKWGDTAFEYFKIFLTHQRGKFKMEDFREWAKDVIPAPPSLRAYGAVTMRAVKLGLIRNVGYTKVKNIKAHRANCALWVPNKP